MTAADPDRLAQARAAGRRYADQVLAVLAALDQQPHRLAVDVATAAGVDAHEAAWVLDVLADLGLAAPHPPSPARWDLTEEGRARLPCA